MQELTISGTYLFTPKIHVDDRGAFLETFRADRLAEHTGYGLNLAQANCSISKRGVLRGVHFADVPPGQAKYVTCAAGQILDVVVDLRVGSPTFGRWESVQLDDVSRQGLYIAEGLGHAFMALSYEATVVYMCSEAYNPAREHGVHPLDPDLGIEWPADITPSLSPKDALAPSFAEAQQTGLLPSYADCQDFYTELRSR